MHFEIYRQHSSLLSQPQNQDFRWRLVANGRTIADSGEGYRNKADCQHAIDLVKATTGMTQVVDHTLPANRLAAALYGTGPWK